MCSVCEFILQQQRLSGNCLLQLEATSKTVHKVNNIHTLVVAPAALSFFTVVVVLLGSCAAKHCNEPI